MTTISTIKLWDLGGSAATVADLDADANAEEVVNTEHSFSSPSDVLLDGGVFRLNVDANDGNNTPAYVRDPVDSDSPTYVAVEDLSFETTSENPTENVDFVRVLENSTEKITIELALADASRIRYTIRSGSLTVEGVVDHDDSADFEVGFRSVNSDFAFTSDGGGVYDRGVTGSVSTTHNDNWFGVGFFDTPWIQTVTTETTRSSGRFNNTNHTFDDSTDVYESRRAWFSFVPTEEADQGTDSHFTVNGSTTSLTASESVTLNTIGWYRFAIVRTDAGGESITLDFDSTTIISATNTQNSYDASGLVEVTSTGAHTLDITFGSTDGDYIIIFWPMYPSTGTTDGKFFAHPGFVSQLPLSDPLRKISVS